VIEYQIDRSIHIYDVNCITLAHLSREAAQDIAFFTQFEHSAPEANPHLDGEISI